MTLLLDSNVLIALSVPEHVHHSFARVWQANARETFATCPTTQGSLLRLLLRRGHRAESAKSVLARLTSHPEHVFWPDGIAYEDVPFDGILGHRQVTDAYLAHLARTNKGRLATFDRGLAELHRDVVDLVPTQT